MNRKIKLGKQQKGFTIIEVLIVLAIAGLIVLIVFLAVPALQRNSRNTQRKNDVSVIVGAVQEYANNNNGQLPANLSDALANAKPGFYDKTTDIIGNTNNGSAVPSVTPNLTGVQVNNFSKCPATVNATGNITTNVGATKRNVTAIYQVETAGGSQNQCQDM